MYFLNWILKSKFKNVVYVCGTCLFLKNICDRNKPQQSRICTPSIGGLLESLEISLKLFWVNILQVGALKSDESSSYLIPNQ